MKNSFKNALYNAIGFIFPIAISLLTIPYIVNKLTTEIYGIYVLAISLMGLMLFLDLGFGQGIIKFISQYEAKNDYEKINRIIETSLFIYLVMGFIGCVLIFSLSDILAQKVFKVSEEYMQTTSMAFKITAFGFIFSFINGVFSNIPKALQRYDLSVKIHNAIWFCSTITTVILLYFGKDLIAILIAYIFFQLVGLVIFFNFSKKLLPRLKIRPRFDKAIFKEIFGFSALTAINSITGNIVFRVDKMLIGAFLGTEAVAYYSIPFMIAQMSNGFISSISQFIFPAVSYANSLVDKERLKQIYDKSTRYIITLSLVIASCLILVGDTFLLLWMGKNFAEKSSFLLPIISLVYFFQSSAVVGYYFYSGLGRPKINMISSFVGSACYLLAAGFLIPELGLKGAAISFAFTLIPFPVYFYILNSLIRGDNQWFISIIAKSIFILIFLLFIKSFIIIPPTIGWFLLIGLSVIVLSLFVSYLLKVLYMSDFLELKEKWRVLWVKV